MFEDSFRFCWVGTLRVETLSCHESMANIGAGSKQILLNKYCSQQENEGFVTLIPESSLLIRPAWFSSLWCEVEFSSPPQHVTGCRPDLWFRDMRMVMDYWHFCWSDGIWSGRRFMLPFLLFLILVFLKSSNCNHIMNDCHACGLSHSWEQIILNIIIFQTNICMITPGRKNWSSRFALQKWNFKSKDSFSSPCEVRI